MENANPFTILSWKHVKKVTYGILWGTDLTTVRAILALSSLFFSIGVYAQSSALQVPQWRVVWDISNTDLWALAFMLHFLGLSWRFLDTVPRLGWALAINSFGLLIWLASTLTIIVSTWKAYGTITPSTALEVVVCLFASWALYRTGHTKETLNP